MPFRVTHLASGLDHLGPGTGPERLDAALFIDVSEGFHRALLAKPAHARLPDLEGHAEGGCLGALDERAEEKVDGRHLRCVFVRSGRGFVSVLFREDWVCAFWDLFGDSFRLNSYEGQSHYQP